MRIDETILDGGEFKPRWVAYREDFEVLLTASTTDEQQRELSGSGRRDVSTAKARKYWCRHVKDWRGLQNRAGEEIPFDERLLEAYYRKDPGFASFLVEECQAVDSFFQADRAS